MNTIKQLLQTFCPNGVEFKELGEIGQFYSGLSGKSKDDFKDGNAKFITYMNVYSNPSTNLEDDSYVKISPNENQNAIEQGDVLFTGSSETPDECGMSSVVVDKVEESYYLNSFCFGFRLNDKSRFDYGYLKHLLRDKYIRKQIAKTANGVTRFNVSKKLFAKIEIPIPPIAVQHKIVEILDNFTELEAELEAKLKAELEARKKQYKYYRNLILNFNNLNRDKKSNVNWEKLGDICKVKRGKRLTKNMLSEDGMYPVYHGGIEPIGFYTKNNREENSVMIIDVGASAGTIGYCKTKFWSSDGCFTLSHEPNIDQRYLYYILKSNELKLKSKVRKAGIPTLDNRQVENLELPFPPLEVQKDIAEKLDKFDNLINDLNEGIPAEIKARHKQYEYYRDQLLTFKRKA